MKQKNKRKLTESAKFHFGHVFLFFGGLFFCWLTYLTAVPALSDEYPQIGGLAIGVFFALFAISCFWSTVRLNRWEAITIPDLNRKPTFWQRLNPTVFMVAGMA